MNIKHLGAAALVSALLASGSAYAQEAPAATDTTTSMAASDAGAAAATDATSMAAADTTAAAPTAMDPAAAPPLTETATAAEVEEDDADFPWGLLGLLGLAGLLGLKKRDDDVTRVHTTTTGTTR